MTAHPKTCPTTGELHFFGYGAPDAPFLTCHQADKDGQLTVSRPVEVGAPTMMHDFHLTSGHVVFMDLPVLFDLPKAMAGHPGMPNTWTPTTAPDSESWTAPTPTVRCAGSTSPPATSSTPSTPIRTANA
jgi:carotenoid cleavage dioxygenase-like enzyme